MRALLLIALLALSVRAADTIAPEEVARAGAGVLYRYGQHSVLVVKGGPRERGLAHGRLLAKEISENSRAFLQEWAIGRRGRTREELEGIWNRIRKHVPAPFLAELEGLAEGSGVPAADLRLLHAIPSRYHCTGAAAVPAVTKDGKVYHTRSLDYSLDIGESVRPQTNSLLLVSVPEKGIPHACVSWAGFLGCVTGMNAEGVSVGEMGSRSRDESYDGLPMIFLLRKVLTSARSMQEALNVWREGPRTCGYNFIVCDEDEACAVECNRSLLRVFLPGDEKEQVEPHYPLPGIVRRCNHFIDRDLAATQREVYDPRKSSTASWGAYDHQGRFLDAARGRIDAATMIALLRTYPAGHPCLHQAVMCPTDRLLWVSQATDPAGDPLAGAQNQEFLGYDLRALARGEAPPATRHGTTSRSSGRTVQTGRVDGERAIEGFFAHPPEAFDFRLEYLRNLGEVSIHRLTYPSPGPSRYPENETVFAEYYRPPGEGPFPCAVVLHILDGRFFVARMLAAHLSQRGIAALFIKLPYYGERRPQAVIDYKKIDLPDVVEAIRQGIRDIRRGAAWLRSRGEIDEQRVGIVGVSLGSFAAQLAAGADGGFDRCAFVLGGASVTDAIYSGGKDTRKIAELLSERSWTKERVAEVLAPVEPISVADRIDGKSVLMVNCREDEVVPPASSRTYWEALGRPTILWYDGGHYGLLGHVFEVLDRVGDHFER